MPKLTGTPKDGMNVIPPPPKGPKLGPYPPYTGGGE